MVSIFSGGIDIIQSAFNLVTAPLGDLTDASGELVDAIIEAPLEIVTSGASTSATAISNQFGPLAFIVGVSITLAGYWIVIQY